EIGPAILLHLLLNLGGDWRVVTGVIGGVHRIVAGVRVPVDAHARGRGVPRIRRSEPSEIGIGMTPLRIEEPRLVLPLADGCRRLREIAGDRSAERKVLAARRGGATRVREQRGGIRLVAVDPRSGGAFALRDAGLPQANVLGDRRPVYLDVVAEV